MQDNTPQVNNKKLYVGNLPYSTTEEDLRELFSQYGEVVAANLITDKMSGRSKGFGFVELADEDSANQAVEATNGMELDGRALVVNVARPLQPRSDDRGGFRPRFQGGNRGGDRRGGYNNRRAA